MTTRSSPDTPVRLIGASLPVRAWSRAGPRAPGFPRVAPSGIIGTVTIGSPGSPHPTRVASTIPADGGERVGDSGPSADDEATSRGDRVAVAVGAVAGAVLVAILVRPHLGATPLWLDEAYSLGVTNQFVEGVRGSGGTMVAYYVLLWGWTLFGDSPGWLRLLSLIGAMAAMVPLAAIGRLIGGWRLAVLAPVLVAGAPQFLNAALEARSYTFEIVVLLACWYVVIRLVQVGPDTARGRRFAILAAVLAPLGVAFHGLFVLFVAAMLVAVALGPCPRRALRSLVPMMITTAVVTGVLALIGLTDVGNWIEPTTGEYLGRTVDAYLGGTGVVRAISALTMSGLAVGVVVGTRRARGDESSGPAARMRRWLATVPLVWVVVPPVLLLVVSLVSPRFVDRYIVGVAPGIALAVGLGIVRGVDAVCRRVGAGPVVRNVGTLALGVLLVAGWVSVGRSAVASRPPARWDALAAEIDMRARPGDGLLLYGDLSRPPFEAAWSRTERAVVPEVLNMDRPLGEVHRYDDPLPLDDTVTQRILDHERIWTVSIEDSELASAVYELSGPLPERFHLVDSWDHRVFRGEATVRLYERDDVAR